MSKVFVHIVTFNHSNSIVSCIQSVLNQQNFISNDNLLIMVTDNASKDESGDLIARVFKDKVYLKQNQENLGFCTAHNQAINFAIRENFDYILILNPDVYLTPDCLTKLIADLEPDLRSGASGPKLLRSDQNLNPITPYKFDSTGIYITPAIRHFDRGSNVEDQGQYNTPQYVFGLTGALMLLRRDFIIDIARLSPGDQFFDESFFAYREDADLAWRAQLLGWRFRYVPDAVAYHTRKVLPNNRQQLPAELNRYSVRNRFLLQLKNFSLIANFSCILPTLIRNVLVLAGVLFHERTSLPAFREIITLLPHCFKARKITFFCRRVSLKSVGQWFKNQPIALPALSFKPSNTAIKSVVVIIINYNSGQRLQRCLAQLTQGSKKLKIIVVDNASKDGSAACVYRFKKKSPDLIFLPLQQNQGFGAAINTAAKQTTSEALLILNPDILIDNQAIETLIHTLDSHENLAAVSPILKDKENNIQFGYCGRRFPTFFSTLAEIFYLHRIWPNNPWTNYYLYQDDNFFSQYLSKEVVVDNGPFNNPKLPLVIDQPAAACLMIKKTVFDKLQGFDGKFWPAWFEDVDFCKRLSNAGYVSAVTSETFVIHEGGYSLSSLSASSYALAWYGNLFRYWKKHSSVPAYLTFRIFAFIGLLLRSLVNLAQGILNKSTSPEYQSQKFLLAKTLVKVALGFRAKATSKDNIQQTIVALLPIQGQINNQSSLYQDHLDWRDYFTEKLRGHGLELGPLHRPMPTHQQIKIDYLDRMPTTELRQHYPELNALPLVELNIIDDAEVLSKVPDHKYDFLISAHLIEHTKNPIQALKNWCRVVKPGGMIYLVVPDKRNMFDRKRARTTLEHIILDYQRPSTARDFEHYLDYAVLVDDHSGNQGLLHAKDLHQRDYSIHFHVFTPEDIVKLISWINNNVVSIEILEGPCKAPDSDEFHLLLQTCSK